MLFPPFRHQEDHGSSNSPHHYDRKRRKKLQIGEVCLDGFWLARLSLSRAFNNQHPQLDDSLFDDTSQLAQHIVIGILCNLRVDLFQLLEIEQCQLQWLLNWFFRNKGYIPAFQIS